MNSQSWFDKFFLAAVLSVAVFVGYKKYNRRLGSQHSTKYQLQTMLILDGQSSLSPRILNTTATSSACTLILKNAVEKSFDDYVKDYFAHHVFALKNTCLSALPSELQKQIDLTSKVCQTSSAESLRTQCKEALVIAKSISMASMIKPDISPNELTETILFHLLINNLWTENFKEHPEKSLLIADAILNQHPQLLEAYKYKLIVIAKSSLRKNSLQRSLFADLLESAEKMSANDDDLLELSLLYEGNYVDQIEDETIPFKNLKKMSDLLQSKIKKVGHSWIYDYYYAFTLYTSNSTQTELIESALLRALALAPNELRIKKTLSEIKSNNSKIQHPFSTIKLFKILE